ncbi:protein gone early [Onthophagus taurus]|uniref:protein gone early n=1 Tax=Onthophagus taurus TaxID=166361 RepID=UPI0039BDCD61
MGDSERNNSPSSVDHKNGRDVKSLEPSEVDPCIDEKIQRNKFLNRAEVAIRRKTGLSQEGVKYAIGLVILTLVLFVIVIALAIAWPSVPHHFEYPICRDPACLRAASQLQQSLNASTSPCEDVWTWACGNWLATNSLPGEKGIWDQKEQLNKREDIVVRDLITTLPLPLQLGTLEWKLMHFYESCMDVDTIEIDKHRPLVSMINELGGWKILKNWNMAEHDGMSLLINLHADYGVSPYFKITVDPSPNVPGSSLIRISPSGLGLPDRSYYYNRNNNDAMEKAYTQFISDVVINFGATKEDADRFGRDLFYYEKRIAEVTPESYELQDPILTYNIRTIHELTQTVPMLYIHDILSKMYPEANIDESTEVIITSPRYLEEVAGISSSTEKGMANSYFIWTLVREYLPYLNNKFAASWNSYNNEIFGVKNAPDRWEFCVGLTRKYMGLAVEVLVEKQNPIKNKTISIVHGVYEELRETISQRLKKFEKTQNLFRHLTFKIRNLRLQIGLPENVTNDDYLKNYYRKLNIIKKSFFINCKSGIRFLQRIDERRLISGHPEDYVLNYLFLKPGRVSYSPSVNKIIIPKVLLNDFYYEDNFPWPIIFGRLGVEISQAIISNILPYDNVWTSDLKLLTQFHITVNESLNAIKSPMRCIEDSIILGKKLSDKTTANLTSLNVIKTISAVRIAEETLNMISKGNLEHVHQPSFETYEDAALFYLTYSQSLCALTAKEYQFYDVIGNNRFPRKLLLEVIWSQVDGFQHAFGCPVDTSEKCDDIF